MVRKIEYVEFSSEYGYNPTAEISCAELSAPNGSSLGELVIISDPHENCESIVDKYRKSNGESTDIHADIRRLSRRFGYSKVLSENNSLEVEGMELKTPLWEIIINNVDTRDGSVDRYNTTAYTISAQQGDIRYDGGYFSVGTKRIEKVKFPVIITPKATQSILELIEPERYPKKPSDSPKRSGRGSFFF